MNNNLFAKAKEVIPGGVNSPARAFRDIGIDPVFIDRAKGPYVYDEKGNEYIDYVLSWGPMILGHSPRQLIDKLQQVITKGTSFGAPTVLETELASRIAAAYPAIDKVRLVNSGTEATMSALRLARGYTGRDKVIKMIGCYHGHNDSLLVEAGSGPATLAIPNSPGIPESLARETIVVPYNDFEAAKKAFKKYGEEIAAVILEPIAGNMGVVLPQTGYLEFLREITDEYQSLLIFDEVITGFRVAYGGVQELYDIKPDLTCLGKIIGGGLPVGAYGGKQEIMDYIAPDGPVYQAGTLSGNPLAVTAGITVLDMLNEEGVYQSLEEKTDYLVQGMKEICREKGIKVSFNSTTGMFSQFFTDKKVAAYQDVNNSNKEMFIKYFKLMLANNVYLAPSPFESTFLSLAHSNDVLDDTLARYRKVMKEL